MMTNFSGGIITSGITDHINVSNVNRSFTNHFNSFQLYSRVLQFNDPSDRENLPPMLSSYLRPIHTGP